MDSSAVCETAVLLDYLSRMLAALGGPNQRKIRSFVSTPAALRKISSYSCLMSYDISMNKYTHSLLIQC